MKKRTNKKAKLKTGRSAAKKSYIEFNGVFTALVTPFKKGAVDFVSLKKLVRSQLDNGVRGFVVNGTTAESPTLTQDEVLKIFTLVKKESDGAAPILLGTGSNCTRKTIEQTKWAAKIGADGALVVVPYYNKPPQRGIVAHYKSVAENSTLPVVMYNVPGRTVVAMSNETIMELMNVRNIIGIKEASGDVSRLTELVRSAPDSFLLTSGDDSTCIDFMLSGGRGVISVISHVIPKELITISRLALNAQLESRALYQKYKELNRLLGIEPNPIPVKMMLYQMGIIASPEMRLPLVELSEQNKLLTLKELKKLGMCK